MIEVLQKHVNEGGNDSNKINQNNTQPHGPEVLSEARESGPVIETAIIAVSPIKRLVTAANSTGWFAFEKKDVIFDITVYVPRTRTWYYVRKGCFEGILRDIVEDGLHWKYFRMVDKVCCSNPDIGTLEILQVHAISSNLPSSTENNRLDILTVEMGDDEEYDLWCVIGDDDCLYLIISDAMDPSFLKCFRHIDNGLWELMFRKPRIDNQRGYSGYMTGHISSSSSEIMLLYIVPTQKPGQRKQSKQLYVFLADLDNDTIMSRTVKQLSAGLHSSHTWKIVEDRDCMYLLEIGGEGIEVTCRYKYKLHSRVLECCNESVVVAEHVNDNKVFLQY